MGQFPHLKALAWAVQQGGMVTKRSICCYCGVGCGITLTESRGSLALAGDTQHPGSQGRLCSKGRALLHVARSHEGRLLHPTWRHAEGEESLAWPEVWARLAERFQAIIAEHGPEAVAFYGSGQSLIEDYYAINKLVKGFLGSNNFDTNSRLCMSAAVVGYKQSLGADAPPCSYADIDQAHSFFLAGSNAAYAHPIIFRRIEDRLQADPNARLIVVDPRRTATAELAHCFLQVKPGTDQLLFHGLARELLQLGAWDEAFLADHVDGVEEFRQFVDAYSLEMVASHCDVPIDEIKRAAHYLSEGPFLTMWAMGLNQSTSGVAKSRGLINLNLITGRIGEPGSGPFSLTGQPNAMGGREVGGMANLNSAHRELADPAHREEVARYWGVDSIPAKPGRTATEMISELEAGTIKAVWVVATNPAASMPQSERVVAALQKAELLVVQDCFHTDTTALADVLLPAATWPEKQGTMTNSERRVALLEQGAEAPGDALDDWKIIQGFARAMGFGRGFAWPDAAAVFAEHVALTAGRDCDYSGLSHERLKREGSRQWPVPHAEHPGTVRLYEDGIFPTANGRARLASIAEEAPAEVCDATYPFVLTTGRLRDQWHTQTKTGRVGRLRAQDPRPYVAIHPEDAQELGLSEGDAVVVRSRRGATTLSCQWDDSLRRGMLFMPMHWGRKLAGAQGASNNTTSPAVDPNSKQPELKFSAVAIEKAPVLNGRLVIIGAGAGCLGLLDELHQRRWAITVIGDEPDPPYDRVQLPHYIDGSRTWLDLQRKSADDFNRDGIAYVQASVQQIDRQAGAVLLADGRRLPYDHLVLATGSAPAIPFQGPLPAKGVGGLRKRADADELLATVHADTPVVIVGGGLLGLELAAALRSRHAQVTILQRGHRLMGKQLDAESAAILADHMRSLGVTIRFQSQLAAVHGEQQVTSLTLQDGTVLPCQRLVFATGTSPNTTLAETAQLPVERGVVVDDQCRTADPRISAIGECAVWQGERFGTTATARRMAAACAAALDGQPHRPFRGATVANILKVPGIELAAAGLVEPPSDDPRYEVVLMTDIRRQWYQKCVVCDDRLVGVICLGDTTRYAEYLELIDEGLELDDLRDQLLRPGGAAATVEGDLVCSCNRIGSGTIQRCIAEGHDELGALCQASRAGTGCGSCRPEVARLLKQALATT